MDLQLQVKNVVGLLSLVAILSGNLASVKAETVERTFTAVEGMGRLAIDPASLNESGVWMTEAGGDKSENGGIVDLDVDVTSRMIQVVVHHDGGVHLMSDTISAPGASFGFASATGGFDVNELHFLLESGHGRGVAYRDRSFAEPVFILTLNDAYYDAEQAQIAVAFEIRLSEIAANALGARQDAVLGEIQLLLRARLTQSLHYDDDGQLFEAELPALATDNATTDSENPGTAGGNGGTVCGATSGPDVIVGVLPGISNYASVGGIEAFAVGTTSCNIGTSNLLWQDSNPNHPVIAQNMYRLKDGRIEMVGMSWLKHGFTALTQNECGCGCSGAGSSVLGVGCSDPYSSSLNGDQDGFSSCGGGVCGGLGPRFEVNASTGAFAWPYTDNGVSGNSIYKRLQVDISDLDPAQDGGGTYFVEGHYVTPDDTAAGNQHNNASYRQCRITGGGSSWSADFVGMPDTVREEPAIRAWKNSDPGVTEVDILSSGEGLYILASKATDIGGGFYHYEYAVHNLNSDQSAGGFEVPIPAGATVQNIGFHDVDYHSGEPWDGTDWTATVGSGVVRWETDTFASDPNANALRWGTMYNFRFDANVEPIQDRAYISMFKSGATTQISGVADVPGGPPPVCGNGDLETGEQCDDGNTTPGDGCDENCNIETECGNEIVEFGEDCDDGNMNNTDACLNTCEDASCGDGFVWGGMEQCDDGGESSACDTDCTTAFCGDGTLNTTRGETCDDGNTTPGDGCDENCMSEDNNDCAGPNLIFDGSTPFDTTSATTDGADHGAGVCGSSGDGSVHNDIWYHYTASCTGELTLTTCEQLGGSANYDTRIAVYDGCGVAPTCPSGALIGCNDDDPDNACGTSGGGFKSTLTVPVAGGECYTVRVGGFAEGDVGMGNIVLSCDGVPADCQEIFADDFQTNQGWVATNLGASSGDWQRGVPVNDPAWEYDPATDGDGSGSCYLTENVAGNTDVDGGAVQLTSPTIDMSAGEISISYFYFLRLTNSDGTDQLLVEINSNDGAGAWTTIAQHTTDGGLNWRFHEISQTDLDTAGVSMTSTMKIRFTANDGDPQSINESGVDGVFVCTTNTGPECVNPIDCDDGNLCTDDDCVAGSCENTPNTVSCDDGNACTTGDTCSAGSCVGGAPPVCNDGNLCTTDSCNPGSGCVFANNSNPCDDGDECTINDACSGGSCAGGGPLVCNDGNLCTTDSCDSESGCVFTNNAAPCDDGDDCTEGDTCSGGSCQPGSPPDCGAGDNTCTDCNDNNIRDDCEGLADCNGDGIPDVCQFADCNSNTVNDICELVGNDCDGGPLGVVADGSTLWGSICFSCHGATGGGGIGPNLQGYSRVQLWNKLTAPTTHPGGVHPEYTQQDYANLEAFLSDVIGEGSGGRPDLTPDDCQALPDCDNNSVADGCDLDAGTHADADFDGVPDFCDSVECFENFDCDDMSVCTYDTCEGISCVFTPNLYGDVTHNNDVDLFDILCVLDGFSNVYDTCPLVDVDIAPCEPNGDVDIIDIFAVLDAFANEPDPCCGGAPSPSIKAPEFQLIQNSKHFSGLEIHTRRDPSRSDRIIADVFVNAFSNLRGYQLQLIATDAGERLILATSAYVDVNRSDFAFRQWNAYRAVDLSRSRIVGVLESGGVAWDKRAYLGTFVFESTDVVDIQFGDATTILDESSTPRRDSGLGGGVSLR